MIVGIDIDDTITDTTLNAREFIKKYDSDYFDYHDLPKEKFDEFLRLYIIDIMSSNKLKEGVQEAFRYLNDNGYKIVIITARENKYSDKVIETTVNYLEKHGLKYDKIVFNQENKGQKAKMNNIELFIDDKENVLDNINKFGIECIRLTSEKSKYKSFSNWCEIIEYLKSREG